MFLALHSWIVKALIVIGTVPMLINLPRKIYAKPAGTLVDVVYFHQQTYHFEFNVVFVCPSFRNKRLLHLHLNKCYKYDGQHDRNGEPKQFSNDDAFKDGCAGATIRSGGRPSYR